jgi:hypothetical protein
LAVIEPIVAGAGGVIASRAMQNYLTSTHDWSTMISVYQDVDVQKIVLQVVPYYLTDNSISSTNMSIGVIDMGYSMSPVMPTTMAELLEANQHLTATTLKPLVKVFTPINKLGKKGFIPIETIVADTAFMGYLNQFSEPDVIPNLVYGFSLRMIFVCLFRKSY